MANPDTGYVVAQIATSPPQCDHHEDTWDAETDTVYEGTGKRCENIATHISCRPYIDSRTCVEHKCRCAKTIEQAKTETEEAELRRAKRDLGDWLVAHPNATWMPRSVGNSHRVDLYARCYERSSVFGEGGSLAIAIFAALKADAEQGAKEKSDG